jgi:hypothetical protein
MLKKLASLLLTVMFVTAIYVLPGCQEKEVETHRTTRINTRTTVEQHPVITE